MNQRSIVFFDGYCNLCSHSVQFILPRDPEGYFRIAPLDGSTAKEKIARHPLPHRPDSLLLWEEGQWWVKSSAALRIARRIKGWNWAWIFRFVPPFIRDAIYDLIARNRFRIWGKRETCYLPRPEWQQRFLP
ncbi:DUF393 domain-containing protein [Cryomorphaceae bacterium]|nr:DUF393 domain-containing protein [Cryomorphaceae bacterium]